MTLFRSRRLETILGKAPDRMDYSDFAALVTNQVAEQFDLDFKSALYGRTDSDKRDLAGDVAAMANTASGVIILGVAEDNQARASGLPGVALSDAETLRMRQIIAQNIAPLPEFDIKPVEDPSRAGYGLYLILAPRSPRAPHAVLVNKGLRYPRRNGASTDYLSEPEVASAYRERFLRVRSQAERLDTIESEAIARLDLSEPWIVVSLVPDLAGDLTINEAARKAYEAETIGRDPTLTQASITWQRIVVGRRRLIAEGRHDATRPVKWLLTELHDDGSAVFAIIASRLRDDVAGSQLDDEWAVTAVLSGLRYIGRLARDRAAAGGDAFVRVRIETKPEHFPMTLTYHRGFGMGDALGRTQLNSGPIPPVERTAALDDLATDSPPLVSMTHMLVSDLFQSFGFGEALQVTRDGRVRKRYWDNSSFTKINSWAGSSGIEVTEEVLPA